MYRCTWIKLFIKCFPDHFNFLKRFFSFFNIFVTQKTIFFGEFWGRNNNGFSLKQHVCVEYPGRGHCIPWRRISRAKFPVGCPKVNRLRLQALYIPTKKTAASPPIKGESLLGHRSTTVVKKPRNLVNYLTSLSLFNARKFVVCIFEISDEDLAPTE